MITVTDAGIKAGYTGYDHLIDSGDKNNVRSIVGRQFRSVAEARRHAERAYESACDRRVRTAPIWLTVRLASGEVRDY